MPETAPSAHREGKLRVAILAEGARVPGWVVDTFSAALASPRVELVGVYRIARGASAPWMERLFRRLDRFDQRRTARGREAPYAADLATALHAARLGPVPVRKLGARFTLDDDVITQIRDRQLDLVFCCASAPFWFLPRVARHGVWGLEIGYGVSAAAPWAGAAELAQGSPLAVLRVMDYSEPIARELYVATCGELVGSSVRRNRLKAVSGSGAVLRRLLNGLDHETADSRPLPRLLPLPQDYPREPLPTAGLMLRTCLRIGCVLLSNRLRRNADDGRWHIAYCFSELELPAVAFDRLRYLTPPPGTFWADPFPLVHEGRHYIFFEELPYRTGVGKLLAVEVFEDRAAGAPMPVLQRNYHLSYPHVFHWQGELYMVPETKNARRVELLRCIEFPSRWEECGTLVENIRAVDATLWYQDATWWMFVGVALEGSATADELHLYFADSLLGQWTAHPANPLCTDVRCARPAGPLFAADGKVYRPSQDSAKRYGHGLWINQIEQLDRTRYVERPQCRIAPDWEPDIRCVHTLGRSGRLTVLDCVIDEGGLDARRGYAKLEPKADKLEPIKA